MSAEALFMSLKKQHGAGIVKVCAVHNMRTDAAEVTANPNIDPSRSHLNVRLAGPDTPEGVAKLAQSLMDAAGVGKVRSTAVRCIEVVFSLHPGSPVADEAAYFRACTAWAEETFGPVLSSDIHNDEPAPHAHVLCLPLVDGRLQGSDLVGIGRRFDAVNQSFFDEVAKPFGMSRPARLTAAEKKAAAAAVLSHLKGTGDAALKSQAWGAIRACIEGNPAPFLSALGIEAPKTPEKPPRSFVSIMS
jgi:Plasmid recombination enzyme